MPYLGDMYTFEEIVEKFRTKEWDVNKWNFCICYERNDAGERVFGAYIMGEGAEQRLTSKHGYATKKEIEDLYHSLGVKYILPI
jgi:hypothetical protein